MRLILPILAILLWATTLSAQSKVSTVITLKQQLAQATSDSTKLRLCTQVAQGYLDESQFDSLYTYAQRGLYLSGKLPPVYPYYTSNLNYFLSRYYRHKGHYQQGIEHIKKAILYAQQSQNVKQLIECQYTLAMLYGDAGERQKSIDQIGKNLTYLSTHPDGPGLAENYLMLMVVFRETHNITMEKFYTDKYVALDKRSWPAVDRMYACTVEADTYEQKGDMQAAYDVYKRAMYFARLTNTPLRIIDIIQLQGNCLRSLKKYQEAIASFNQSFIKSRSLQSVSYMANSQRELALTYLASERASQALPHARYSLSLARQNKERNGIIASLQSLADILAATGHYKEALKVYSEKQQVIQQKYTEQIIQQIAEVQAKFEIESKDKTIKILQKNAQIDHLSTLRQQEKLTLAQRTQIAAIIIIGLLMLFMGVVYYFLRKSQQSNLLLTQQQALLQKTATELADTNAVKDKLFSLISHDLRSPVASMKVNVRQIREVDQEPELFLSLMNRLDKQVDNVLTLLTNLLDWSMIQLKGFQSLLQPINLFDVTEETVSQASELIYQKQLTVINQVDKEHVALADKHQLRAVVRNILGNAIKFTPVGGYIRLHSIDHGATVELQIRDSGLGMSPEQIDTLFGSPEVRTGTTGERGIGLGLRICREMMDRQNGTLHVKSRPNGGTSVSIRLTVPTEKRQLAPGIA